MNLIFDLILIAIVVFCIISGYRRGFVATVERMLYFVVVGTLAMMLRPVGAAVIRTTPLPEVIQNKAQLIIEENVGDRLQQVVDQEQLTNLLSESVLPEAMAEMLSEQIMEAGQFISQDKTQMISSVSNAISNFVVEAVAVIVLFIILSVAYFLIFRMLGLAVKLPLLKQADQILGMSGGLLSAVITLGVALWLASAIAPFVPEVSSVLSSSFVYGLYMKII